MRRRVATKQEGWRHLRPTLFAAAAVILAGSPQWSFGVEPERLVGYVYVEPNEGGSSGGHVAVRFGDETFHYQHQSPGVLRLHRDDTVDFLFRYALLQNRGVRESRIAASAETFDLLRDAFNRRALIETAQFEHAAGLDADAALVASLRSTSPPAVLLPGFGYFPPPAPGADRDLEATGDRSPALLVLRECVRRRQGAGFLQRRVAEIEDRLRTLRPKQGAYDDVALRADVYPAFAPLFSTQYLDLLAAREALRLLDRAPRLDPAAFRQADELSPGEEVELAAFARSAADELCLVPASPRPDWGAALAIGMARLAAVELSLARHRWVVLDAFPSAAKEAVLPDGRLRREYLDVLEAETAADLEKARAELVGSERFREAAYANVEAAANRLLEARAARLGAPLRLQRDVLVPARAGRVTAVAPTWAPGEADLHLVTALAAARRFEAGLGVLYAYDLIRRNCVSEIFATVDAAFAGDELADHGAAVRLASRRQLGGHVSTKRNLSFIPLVSERAVAANYRVFDWVELASYRRLRLAEMESSEPAWRVWLRESNTFTSVAYRPGADDSSFLFFTEEPPVLRPLLGAANVVYGLADSAAGVITMPLSGPDRFLRAVRGLLYSMPELVFVNLRKGTSSFVERRWTKELIPVTPPSVSAAASG